MERSSCKSAIRTVGRKRRTDKIEGMHEWWSSGRGRKDEGGREAMDDRARVVDGGIERLVRNPLHHAAL